MTTDSCINGAGLEAVLNYGAVSNNWTQLWDTHPQWEYGYIIGPIAAYLLYCLLTEKPEQWRHDLLDTKLPPGMH